MNLYEMLSLTGPNDREGRPRGARVVVQWRAARVQPITPNPQPIPAPTPVVMALDTENASLGAECKNRM